MNTSITECLHCDMSSGQHQPRCPNRRSVPPPSRDNNPRSRATSPATPQAIRPSPPKVKIESEYLSVLRVETIEGNTCAMVTCPDYHHYQKLPQVVSYNGQLLSKTGWSSDSEHAHYQSNASVLKIEKR